MKPLTKLIVSIKTDRTNTHLRKHLARAWLRIRWHMGPTRQRLAYAMLGPYGAMLSDVQDCTDTGKLAQAFKAQDTTVAYAGILSLDADGNIKHGYKRMQQIKAQVP